MKTNKLSKKLGLNKKTIANLNTDKMSEIMGGYTLTTFTCPTECDNTCYMCTLQTECDQDSCQPTCHKLITG